VIAAVRELELVIVGDLVADPDKLRALSPV